MTFGSTPTVTFLLLFRFSRFRALWDLLPLTSIEDDIVCVCVCACAGDVQQVGKVSLAHIQGFENNLRHLRDRAIVQWSHPCAPVVFRNGQKMDLKSIFKELWMALRRDE